ncbi:MAG: hypothetical protein GXP09_05540 [Gammaproteobacteria bacterium]|nr:hypothetical protein [Gammaproteobacteria bacterium]
MATTADSQIEAIQSMLASGHRSIRIERHSLVIWGLAGALLCVIGEMLINHQTLPERWQRAVAVVLLLGGVIFSACWLDFRRTRALRRSRDETVSFVQGQVLKLWWLLLGMGILLNFAMVFFGGGYMSYTIWIVLIGLGLFVYGLFSEQALEWGGALLITLAIGMLMFKVPYQGMRWTAVAAFGVGMPLLGFLVTPSGRGVMRRSAESGLWLLLVAVSAWALYTWTAPTRVPDLPVVSLDAFKQQTLAPKYQAVTLPAGTSIPIRISLGGEVIESVIEYPMSITLKKSIDIVLADGKPDGRFRVQGGPWQSRTYDFRLRRLKREAHLGVQGPALEIDLQFWTRP